MEYFIEVSGMLLHRHEFAGGASVKDKINSARRKMVSKGEAEIVTEDFFLTGEKRTNIKRKGYV